MHHPTDRITHTTAFDTPVMEHWLEREIAQWEYRDKVIHIYIYALAELGDGGGGGGGVIYFVLKNIFRKICLYYLRFLLQYIISLIITYHFTRLEL